MASFDASSRRGVLQKPAILRDRVTGEHRPEGIADQDHPWQSAPNSVPNTVTGDLCADARRLADIIERLQNSAQLRVPERRKRKPPSGSGPRMKVSPSARRIGPGSISPRSGAIRGPRRSFQYSNTWRLDACFIASPCLIFAHAPARPCPLSGHLRALSIFHRQMSRCRAAVAMRALMFGAIGC